MICLNELVVHSNYDPEVPTRQFGTEALCFAAKWYYGSPTPAYLREVIATQLLHLFEIFHKSSVNAHEEIMFEYVVGKWRASDAESFGIIPV